MSAQEAMLNRIATRSPWRCMLMAVLCTAQLVSRITAHRLGVVIESREEPCPGCHDMNAVAKSLERRDHQVVMKEVNIPGTDWRALVTEDDLVTPKYDAILASGVAAISGEGTPSHTCHAKSCCANAKHFYSAHCDCMPLHA